MSLASLLLATSILSLCTWIYLVFARGGFWRLQAFDGDQAEIPNPGEWPSVVAIVPARNEAETIAQSVASLTRQKYEGEFRVVVVDDHSEDATVKIALRAARDNHAAERVTIHSAESLPAGWTGKLWALNKGVANAAKHSPIFYWFTDADVAHAPDALQRLVARAERDKLDLVSLMVLLQAKTLAERLLIPPFLYFFLKLYPPRWIANVHAHTAGAAGGCILLHSAALHRIGGFAAIRSQVIDDCELAAIVKRSGGRIWMGLTRASVSLRDYETFGEIRDLIARTAFTQLGYSALLLAGTLAGMFITYLAPLTLLFAPRAAPRILALAAWALMSFTYSPTVRFYRLSPLWAPFLPLAALFYFYATWLSAARFWLGRGAQWKGRSQAPRHV